MNTQLESEVSYKRREPTPAERHDTTVDDIRFMDAAIQTAKDEDNVGGAMQFQAHKIKLINQLRDQDKQDKLLIPIEDVRAMGYSFLAFFNDTIEATCSAEQIIILRREISKGLAAELEPFN